MKKFLTITLFITSLVIQLQIIVAADYEYNCTIETTRRVVKELQNEQQSNNNVELDKVNYCRALENKLNIEYEELKNNMNETLQQNANRLRTPKLRTEFIINSTNYLMIPKLQEARQWQYSQLQRAGCRP